MTAMHDCASLLRTQFFVAYANDMNNGLADPCPACADCITLLETASNEAIQRDLMLNLTNCQGLKKE